MKKSAPLSTSEAKYAAVAEVCPEDRFLRFSSRIILSSFGNLETNSNSNHIGIRHLCLREGVQQGEFGITHEKTRKQHDDVLTETPTKNAFHSNRNFVIHISWHISWLCWLLYFWYVSVWCLCFLIFSFWCLICSAKIWVLRFMLFRFECFC